jgi:glucose-6-phosphate 1-dehydrogenase
VIEQLLLIGATGDLAGRFLLPALAALHAVDELPDGFRVVGAAAGDWDDESFRRHAAQQLEEHATQVPAGSREAVVRALSYRQVDVGRADSVDQLLAATVDGPVAVYLALPPVLFRPTVTALAAVGLPAGSRVALEKPFGDDESSAAGLNALLARAAGAAGEQAVFRVDHALGMATVQNLLGLRLADGLLQRVWNSRHIEQIDVLWEETLALEGRAGYYDGTGALKDVVQNHMLQLLTLAAMEPPTEPGERALRNAKVAALRSVRRLSAGDVATRTRRARYTAGRLAGTGGASDREVPDYADEDGVDPGRSTETFAEIVLELDSPRWSGTRFRLRAGKALAQRRKGLLVHFRSSPSPSLGGQAPGFGDELWIGIDGPDDVSLQLTGRAADGSPPELVPVTLTGAAPPSPLPPYSRVLLDVLAGDSSLSVRGDEAEAAWGVLDPVVRGWAAGEPPLLDYPAGSGGPPPVEG